MVVATTVVEATGFPWRQVIRQVRRVSDQQVDVRITIHSKLTGNWLPAASSHSKEEEDEDDDGQEGKGWIAVGKL